MRRVEDDGPLLLGIDRRRRRRARTRNQGMRDGEQVLRQLLHGLHCRPAQTLVDNDTLKLSSTLEDGRVEPVAKIFCDDEFVMRSSS